MLKKDFTQKFAYLLIGALIGFIFNYALSMKSLEKQNYYEDRSERREFVLELCELMQERIYNAEVFFWSIRDEDRTQTILTSWDRYKDSTIKWNKKLINIYIKLDMFFPEKKYCVKFVKLDDIISFRDFLVGIQDEFISVHGKLIRLKKMANNSEVPDKKTLKEIQKEIEGLHVVIANYLQDLANASKN